MITSSVQTTRCHFCFSGSFHVLQPEWVSFEATGPVSCTSISCFSGYNNSLILTEPLTQELPEDVTRAHTPPGATRLRTSAWWRSEHAALASGFRGCCWGHARGPDTGEWTVPPPHPVSAVSRRWVAARTPRARSSEHLFNPETCALQ